MKPNVIQFPHAQTPRTEIAKFVRVGEFHRQFSDLNAGGFLPLKRAVFEASRIIKQKDVLKQFRADGIEITLDLGAAEISSLNRFSTHFKNAPWLGGVVSRPLGPEDYSEDHIKAMARLAVEYDVHRVLSPTHFLGDPLHSKWLRADQVLCEKLRRALDAEGGGNIEIDYTVIHSSTGLCDPTVRKELSEGLTSLPINNLWFRVPGLKKTPGPQITRTLIRSLGRFHNLGFPVVLDYCSGLNAEAAIAFGAASGASFGILEQEQFSTANWQKAQPPRDPDKKFGRAKIVPVPGLGRNFREKEFRILAAAPGGRRLLIPQEQSSANNVDEMVRKRKQYAARDVIHSIDSIEDVPDLNRVKHFLDKPLKKTERRARDISKLRPSAQEAEEVGVNLPSLMKRVQTHYETIEKVGIALNDLHEELGGDQPRSRVCENKALGSREIQKDRKR